METIPTPQTLRVWNGEEREMAFGTSENAPWLSRTPSAGISDGPDDAVRIALSVDVSGLEPGSYTASVRISGRRIGNSPPTRARDPDGTAPGICPRTSLSQRAHRDRHTGLHVAPHRTRKCRVRRSGHRGREAGPCITAFPAGRPGARHPGGGPPDPRARRRDSSAPSPSPPERS